MRKRGKTNNKTKNKFRKPKRKRKRRRNCTKKRCGKRKRNKKNKPRKKRRRKFQFRMGSRTPHFNEGTTKSSINQTAINQKFHDKNISKSGWKTIKLK